MIVNDVGDMIRYGILFSNCFQCYGLKEYIFFIQSFWFLIFILNLLLVIIIVQEESNYDKNDCNKRYCGDNGNVNGGRCL